MFFHSSLADWYLLSLWAVWLWKNRCISAWPRCPSAGPGKYLDFLHYPLSAPKILCFQAHFLSCFLLSCWIFKQASYNVPPYILNNFSILPCPQMLLFVIALLPPCSIILFFYLNLTFPMQPSLLLWTCRQQVLPVTKSMSDYVLSHPRREKPSLSEPRKPQISHVTTLRKL